MRTTLPPSLAKLIAAGTQGTGGLMQATAAIQRALGRGAPGLGAPLRTARRSPHPDVLDGLVTELRRPGAAAPHDVSPQAGARFSEHQYQSTVGARSYKLFVPAAAESGTPLPLLVMLHGCTQNPDDFAAGTGMNGLAQRDGFFVLYPAQAPRSNSSKCWNWFNPQDQRQGGGEPALLAGMARQVMAGHAVDPERVYVAGLSAGGAMAAILAREYPDLFAAVGVHSGLPQGAASDVASAFAVMKNGQRRPQRSHGGTAKRHLPTIVFHGDQDPTVHPANGRHVIADALAAAPAAAAPTVSRESAGAGRTATRTVYRDAAGRTHAEHWEVHGAGHAWSGGSASGSYTDPNGPDASAEMLRFFRENPRGA